MTRLRFRAWNSAAKCFYPTDHFALRCDGVWLQRMPGDVWHPCQGSMIFMQSTGVTDKNGIEIFEGDVMSDPLPNGEPWYSEVKMENAMWMPRGMEKYEVIGNIYSNPDLLPSHQ